MEFEFQSLEKRHALAILSWRYPAPYDVYNFDPENHQANLCYLLDPKNAFFAILNRQGELEGYCSFGTDGQVPGGNYSAQALDIGMGIRPDWVGKGRGKMYVSAVARYGTQRYQPRQLRVTIAAFNQRAQRVWQKLGFEPVEMFEKIEDGERSGKNFIVMMGRV
ncbi:MAG: GNAT family N-acetyltransferase [Cyanobacteria bacterium P01_D01_bin.44]